MTAQVRRLLLAAIVAALATGPLLLFANFCGNVHGGSCGEAGSFAARMVAAPLYLLLAVLDVGFAPAGTLNVLFALTTFLSTLLLVYGALCARDLFK